MANKNVLDFRAQAEQMMKITEARLNQGQKEMAVDFMVLKFKALYEQGISSGRLYEKEGIYPYTPIHDDQR